MCVVVTYEIMHVIVYFGVCKCHGCSSHLCNWMFNLVNHAYNIYVVVLCAMTSHTDHTREPVGSLTIVYHQAFAHNTHGLLVAIVYVIIGLCTHF